MSGLAGARCVGEGPLFESVERLDHLYAKAMCETCPAAVACDELRKTLQSPVGTWAGKLYGAATPRPEPKERRPGGRRPLPREHGTDRGYYQHHTYREATCRDCKAAHKVAVWLRSKDKGASV